MGSRQAVWPIHDFVYDEHKFVLRNDDKIEIYRADQTPEMFVATLDEPRLSLEDRNTVIKAIRKHIKSRPFNHESYNWLHALNKLGLLEIYEDK